MIVCHCNVISCGEIRQAVHRLLADDPAARLHPHDVYRALEKRGRCCGCFPSVEALVSGILEGACADVEDVVERAAAFVESHV